MHTSSICSSVGFLFSHTTELVVVNRERNCLFHTQYPPSPSFPRVIGDREVPSRENKP